jgi:hypothetical protein
MKSVVNILVHLVIACSIVRTFFSKTPNLVIEQSDKEYSSWCRFNWNDYPKALACVFKWYLLKLCFVQGEMKSHKVQKG